VQSGLPLMYLSDFEFPIQDFPAERLSPGGTGTEIGDVRSSKWWCSAPKVRQVIAQA